MPERVAATIKAPEAKQICSTSCKQKPVFISSGSPTDMILQLQRTAGNQAVQRLIKSGASQAKLRIGKPNDIYEQEADRVAEQVMRMPDSVIQRKCSKCNKDKNKILQAKKSPGQAALNQGQDVPPVMREVINPPSQLLDPTTRAFMEPRFGHDFSGVRVYTDEKAAESTRAVNAKAYTVGKDVMFGTGQYDLGTKEGRNLLAHELTHVIHQQNAIKSSNSSHDQFYISHRSLDHLIQRRIRVGGTVLDAPRRRQLSNDLIRNKLQDIVPKVVSADLVHEILDEMYKVSDVLDFADANAVASNVRHRVLLSHFMRASQGSTKASKAFSYPNSKKDKTFGVGPKVNDEAIDYWGPIQYSGHNYYFDLSPIGLKNPYQALMKLFKEHTDPHKRTLIHCDYLVSVLELRAYAENVGVKRFNTIMQDLSTRPGAQPMRLKWNAFTDLLGALGWRTVVGPAPLKLVRVSSENDLIVGDHVAFYNHESYEALKKGVGGVWRLENAIVVDRVGGKLRFQGHGYFSPVTKEKLITMHGGLIYYYNEHIKAANTIIHRIKHGNAAAKAAARHQLANNYQYVKEKPTGGWEINGPGLCGVNVTRDLKPLTMTEVPGLKNPCNSDQIWVRRPVEKQP